jgi:hypothetical protein
LIIANPDSLEASLFLRIAATPNAGDRWVTSKSAPRPVDWDRLTAFALLENAVTLLDERVSRVPDSLIPPRPIERYTGARGRRTQATTCSISIAFLTLSRRDLMVQLRPRCSRYVDVV